MERKKRRNIKDEKNVRGKRKGMCVEDRVEKRELTNFKRVVRFGAMFSLIFSSVIKEKGKKYVKFFTLFRTNVGPTLEKFRRLVLDSQYWINVDAYIGRVFGIPQTMDDR